MSRYENIKFVLISPDELKLPEYVKEEILEKNNIGYVETNDIEEYMDKLDILYMTRVQRERFASEDDYLRLKDCYILNNAKLEKAKNDLCIMHPLPRVNEISTEVDDDPRACYFKQVLCGKYIRMALIMKLLSERNAPKIKGEETPLTITNKIKCKNTRCITSIEQELDHVFILTDKDKKLYRCKYCENLNEE